jgi:hypothetical protein
MIVRRAVVAGLLSAVGALGFAGAGHHAQRLALQCARLRGAPVILACADEVIE